MCTWSFRRRERSIENLMKRINGQDFSKFARNFKPKKLKKPQIGGGMLKENHTTGHEMRLQINNEKEENVKAARKIKAPSVQTKTRLTADFLSDTR
jgi:hypothetical protein